MDTAENTVCNGWKETIYSLLLQRDKYYAGYAEIIGHLQTQVEQCEEYRLENMQLIIKQRNESPDRSFSNSPCLSDGKSVGKIQHLEQKLYKLQEELTCLHRSKGDTAEQLLSLNTALQEKEKNILDLQNKVAELQSDLMISHEALSKSKEEIENMTSLNDLLRDEYKTLNLAYESLRAQYVQKKDDYDQLLKRYLDYKSKDAERMNQENDEVYQSKQRELERSIKEAAEDNAVFIDEDELEECDQALGSIVCPYSIVPNTCYFKLECHDADLHTLQINNNGRIVATGGEDKRVKLWNISRDGLTLCHTLLGSNAGINSVDFSIDNALVIAASTDCAARVWTVSDLRIRHTFTGHSAKVMACKFVTDGSKVVTGAHDRTVKIWDLKSKACVRTFFAGSMCNDLDVSRSSPFIIYSGHQDKKLRLYDLRLEKETAAISLHDKITSVSLFNNGYHCLASCRDNILRLVDVRQNQTFLEFGAEGFHIGSDMSRACVAPDDTHVAVGAADGSLFVWDAKIGSLASSSSAAHSSCVMACSWTPDGQSFISCERSKSIGLWTHFRAA